MLTDPQKQAIRRWYMEPATLERARALHGAQDYEDLEEFLHKGALWPLGRHENLPDYMKDADGKALFPTNLDPREDEDLWQDAIDLAWVVMKEELGIDHDDIHKAVATEQADEWQAFLDSVEARKKAKE